MARENLTERHQRSHQKGVEKKEQRTRLEELRRQRRAERAAGPTRPPRQRGQLYSDDDLPEGDAEAAAKPRRAAPGPARAVPVAAALGRVVEIHPGVALVMHEGRTVRAALPPPADAPARVTRGSLAVGDRVRLDRVAEREARVVEVLRRRTALTRGASDRPHETHVLAANIDQVVVVCTPKEPPFRPRLVDRYLVAASRDGLPVVLCLNKTDLGLTPAVEAYLRGYEGLGIRVVQTSAVSEEGMGDLAAQIAGRTSLFTGHSGVGKSSLLNALEPGLGLKAREVTRSTAGQGKGRHTTSSARLIALSTEETFIVDSPGIRAFGLRGMAPRRLAARFSDIAALAPSCRFHDCLHGAEPDCAVEARAQADWFLRRRVQSYRALLRELE